MNTSKRAKRLYFSVDINNLFDEHVVEFEWFSGFAKVQKEKSIISMHQNIKKEENNNDLKILEVSSNSTEPLGRSLSAFNLRFRDIPIECIFQGSKVFSDGGPYLELLVKKREENLWEWSKRAKTFEKIKTDKKLYPNRNLKCFQFDNKIFPLEPKSFFYDYIYISAINKEEMLLQEILNRGFTIFTDIEFNQKIPFCVNKGPFNCQARSLAMAIGLYKQNRLKQYIDNPDSVKNLYRTFLNKQQFLFE